MTEPLRIANCSGFYGDRLSAAREMVEGGPIDVLTGDWLAELTMLILWKGYQRDSSKGWAHTFLTQMEAGARHLYSTAASKWSPTPAASTRPAWPTRSAPWPIGWACRCRWPMSTATTCSPGSASSTRPATPWPTSTPAAAGRCAGARWSRPTPTSAAGPSSRRSSGGADVVICPRITDASLVVGPAAWHHGWSPTDWDRLAGAVVAGHVIECGPQATGGNYAFFTEVPGLEHPGFPIAEVAADGSSVITKHPGTGGEVSVGTVTAQLLYEIAGHHYPNTDVVARFDTVERRPGRARTGCGSAAPGASRPPTRSRCASTCWAAGATR